MNTVKTYFKRGDNIDRGMLRGEKGSQEELFDKQFHLLTVALSKYFRNIVKPFQIKLRKPKRLKKDYMLKSRC